MPPRRLQRRLGVLAAAAALGLAGCASSSLQSEASQFVGEHRLAATRAARATKAVEQQASVHSRATDSAGLEGLGQSARTARRKLVQAGEWAAAGGGMEGVEEEDLPRAESQITEAADELAGAMAAIQAYVRTPRAAILARYESRLLKGREQWDEGISELWHLARAADPPLL